MSKPLARLAALLLLPALSAQAPQPGQVAAPPADIQSALLRLSERHVERSRSALQPLDWQRTDTGWRARVAVNAEGDPALSLALLGADVAGWSLAVRGAGLPPSDVRTLVATGRAERAFTSLDAILPGWSAETFTLHELAPGRVTVDVHAAGATTPSYGFLASGGRTDVTLASTVEGWRRTSEREIPVRAWIEEETARLGSVELALETPHGPLRVPLLDDGLGADEHAGDGVHAGWLPRGLEGALFARVVARGETAEGAPFVRTTQEHVRVLAPRARLTGAVSTTVLGPGELAIDVEVQARSTDKLQLSFELWGERPGSGPVPVVWLSRMSTPRASGSHTVRLVLDARWLNAAGAATGLALRHVRLQDPDSHVVLDALERLALPVGALPAAVGQAPTPITRDMLTRAVATPTGPGARSALAPAPVRAPENPTLLLLHGYCSGGDIWPTADFTQPKRAFNDPDQNRSHDEFAQLIAGFAAAEGIDSFGVVAHSQGGAAALHLLTYYQSGLDLARGPRRIQSLATPYQGTPLASLGSFACGVNDDLTPAGSAAWLAGIPSWARAEVHYWTVSDSGPDCVPFIFLFLSSPNDGTVEVARGQLPGGNGYGNKTGWCHTTGMNEPASYTDSVRNVEMNAFAAR